MCVGGSDGSTRGRKTVFDRDLLSSLGMGEGKEEGHNM